MSNTLITDADIDAAISGNGKRAYLCTWQNGVQKYIWADTAKHARRIAIEWAIRYEFSAATYAGPMLITWEKGL